MHVLQLELFVTFVDVFLDGLGASDDPFGAEDRNAALVDHVGDMLAHVEQIAGTFVAITTYGFSHYILVRGLRYSVVVQFPPALLKSVVNIRVVVTVLGQSIVNYDRVQIVWPLLLLDVGFFEDLLDVFDLALEDVYLILGCVFESLKDMFSDLDLFHGNTELALGQLLWVEEVKLLVLNAYFCA